jgi:hypothetical protein
MKTASALLYLVAIQLAFAAGDDSKTVVKFAGKVSKLGIPAEQLGSQWIGPTGLVIDDFQDLSSYPDDVKDVVQELKKQVSALGVVQTGDFTYRKKLNPLHQVTLRVFVFDSVASCQDWWKKKYQYDGWDKQYSVVEGLPYSAVDSKDMTKRAVSFGDVWITCGALDKTDDHIKILELYLKKVQGDLGGERR